MEHSDLTSLVAGTPIPWGGTKVAYVSAELADAFRPGDALIVVQDTGELLHIPAEPRHRADIAVSAAVEAFGAMGAVSDEQITDFYLRFASALADDASFTPIADANRHDVESARDRGRSVTRLILDERMRSDMVEGLKGWAQTPSGRGRVVETIEHEGWSLAQIVDGLGVIGFVFEGRPNVFADATGVLRGGNTVVFRIGSDALGTAKAIVDHALAPALAASGLPSGAASLVESPSRASGIAMMSDPRLSLAVARGSGEATQRLGAVARQAGNSVSLHGTGGAWIVAGDTARIGDFEAAVYHSLDRKVCNTLNTACVPRSRVGDLVPALLKAMERAAARRDANPKLHVLESSRASVPNEWFDRSVAISRAEGAVDEPQAETLTEDQLGVEWEWEDSPEVTLAVSDDVEQAIGWFNRYSPRFVASLISSDPSEHDAFFRSIDAPFVGNGFTRWVDGQYALDRPELGLSNWQMGRLFGRGGILSGDSAYTIRTRVTQQDPDIGR
ncbi:MAG: aldehyde dehydrogenase family protein [Acidimicrobiia bacterium]